MGLLTELVQDPKYSMMAFNNNRLKEDYERPLVEMIKRHFRRKQKQWEKSLDTRVQMVSSKESKKLHALRQVSEDSVDLENNETLSSLVNVTIDNNNKTETSASTICNQCQLKRETLANNLAAATSSHEEAGGTLVVQVNTKFFSLDDSITVRRESDTVVLLCAECTRTCKRKCRPVRAEKTVVVPVSSASSRTPRVITTREGLLRLEIESEAHAAPL